LSLPAGISPETGRNLVAAALGAGDIASLLLKAGPDQVRTAELVKPLCHAHSVVLLLDCDAAAAQMIGADGVQLAPDGALLTEARARLGDAAVLGVDCGDSRHLAMTMGERGADYIGFSGLSSTGEPSIIAWWSEIFELPSVALDPVEEDAARRLRAEGADFITPSLAMWRSEEAAAAAVVSYNSLLGNN
jgi:thiamine-phosphate pyrophosphorylase